MAQYSYHDACIFLAHFCLRSLHDELNRSHQWTCILIYILQKVLYSLFGYTHFLIEIIVAVAAPLQRVYQVEFGFGKSSARTNNEP